jgi:hypothetical protein
LWCGGCHSAGSVQAYWRSPCYAAIGEAMK